MDRKPLLIASAAFLALASASTAGADVLEEFELEAGMLAGHHDNFFYRGGDEEAPSENLYTTYGQADLELGAGPGDFLLGMRAAAITTTEIPGSDYQDYRLRAGYKIRSTRILGEAVYAPDRIFFEEADGVFYDLSGRSAEVRQGITSGLWVGAEYEHQAWEFDPLESDRDATVRAISGTVRIPLGSRLGARATITRDVKEAVAPEYSWDGHGYALALEIQPSDRLDLLLRYKRRDRTYEDAPPLTSNFERDDTTQDLLLSIRWEAGPHWGLQLEDAYRDGDSTRADRNYEANSIAGGCFILFGPERE